MPSSLKIILIQYHYCSPSKLNFLSRQLTGREREKKVMGMVSQHIAVFIRISTFTVGKKLSRGCGTEINVF